MGQNQNKSISSMKLYELIPVRARAMSRRVSRSVVGQTPFSEMMARVRFRRGTFSTKNPFFGQEGAGSIPEKKRALFREFYFQERRSHPPFPPVNRSTRAKSRKHHSRWFGSCARSRQRMRSGFHLHRRLPLLTCSANRLPQPQVLGFPLE